MEFKYTSNLIERTIKNFKKEDGLDISVETAIEYLDGLSGLFLAFASGSPRSPRSAGDADASPDLITPHSCNK